MITWLDRDVGKILTRLEELNLARRTIVMFSSDNGAQSYTPHSETFFNSVGGLRGRKTEVYEGGIRVPFIVRWPGVVEAGSVSDHVSAFWDFLPTCAELVGVDPPAGIDGLSLLPTLRGESGQAEHDYLYWEYPAAGYRRAVRRGDWKAVIPEVGSPLELYNLAADPTESQNLAGQEPDLAREFTQLFANARTESPHWSLE
jgi:arylsulfatase A-like enzyme